MKISPEKLKAWFIAATHVEIETLAKNCGTSIRYLQQLANRHRTASAELAGKIEREADKIAARSGRKFPKMTRMDFAPACASCPYAKAMMKKGGPR